jgi:hypothetical protein
VRRFLKVFHSLQDQNQAEDWAKVS